MTVRQHFSAVLLMALLASCSARESLSERPSRVLFFGNSVTYVGNLPAVFSALCGVSRKRCSAEMIVAGGATLTDRVSDSSLERALARARFDYLVLQERGGDVMGSMMNQSEAQERAESAATMLVQAARKRSIEPVLLGTYQVRPEASKALVTAERALARRLGVAYVPVSDYLVCGRQSSSSLRWFDRDGMHPGPELTLMMATLLYRELFGSFPSVDQIVVRAPIYAVYSGLSAGEFASDQPVLPETASSITYDADTVRAMIELAQEKCD